MGTITIAFPLSDTEVAFQRMQRSAAESVLPVLLTGTLGLPGCYELLIVIHYECDSGIDLKKKLNQNSCQFD